MRLEVIPRAVRRIVNVHEHVDGAWFWTKYSANPYVGCRSGCEFCYLRGGRHLGNRPADSFDTVIGYKSDAAERLEQELPQLQPDLLSIGDWQEPVERRHRLSRKMLEVAARHRFGVFIIERSPTVLRDLDVIVEAHNRGTACVVFSIASVRADIKGAFEPRSPGIRRRLQAMRAFADAGIPTGVALMPIIPGVTDGRADLDAVVSAVADHGGQFIIGAGVTMHGEQAERTIAAAKRIAPDGDATLRRLAAVPKHRRRCYNAGLGRRIRDVCQRHGIADRMPRPILEGPKKLNKRAAEYLFLRAYELELDEASQSRIWAYRKAAWAVDELDIPLRAFMEDSMLTELPDIPGSIATQIEAWVRTHASPTTRLCRSVANAHPKK